MIIYLYGPDSYRRQKKLKEITFAYKQKHLGLTTENFDLIEEEAWTRFRQFLGAQSLFGSSKLAIISGLGELKDKEVFKIIKPLMEVEGLTLVILEDKKLNKDFDFLLHKPALSQNFDYLNPNQLSAFIKKEIQKREISLPINLINLLAETYASDTWGLVTELDKLALGGEFEKILPHINIFRTKFNLISLEHLLINEDPAKIFNLIAYQTREKEKFADYDAAVKSGKLDYETALLDLAIS